jgi:hypothetical protein
MVNNFIYFIISGLLLTLVSCDKEPDLNIPEPDDKIVIDGWIENEQYARVLLTSNTPYFSDLDSASIRELVLTRAKVTLTDGVDSETLILRKDKNYFPPYIYEGNSIKGETGKSYTLTAEYGGKKAYATTSIAVSVPLDTLYSVKKDGSDSLRTMYIEFTDPGDEINYYRVLTMVKGKDSRYTSSTLMAISDRYFSGQKFGFRLMRGKSNILTAENERYFVKGDTVSMKFCTIDKEHYEFWNTYQDEIMNASNPFASSVSVIKSNVKGDGLGIWGGYGVSLYTCIVN